MTIDELIKILKAKDPSIEVEVIVVETDGEVVAMWIAEQAKSIIKALKRFRHE